jgi:acetyl-CoA synthetase
VVFEGIPTYPDVSRCWNIIDKHKINIFYTAPTVIRSLMAHGDFFVTRTSRKSLRLLGTAGEPINPEAWKWYHRVVGDGRCPVIDTWWQVSPLLVESTSRPLLSYLLLSLNSRLKQVL